MRIGSSLLSLLLLVSCSQLQLSKTTTNTRPRGSLGDEVIDTGELGVYFLNVGQGDCVLIVGKSSGSRHEAVLFDCGTGIGGGTGAMSDQQLVSFIREKTGNGDALSAVIVSHGDCVKARAKGSTTDRVKGSHS